jgi:hypothetical protein
VAEVWWHSFLAPVYVVNNRTNATCRAHRSDRTYIDESLTPRSLDPDQSAHSALHILLSTNLAAPTTNTHLTYRIKNDDALVHLHPLPARGPSPRTHARSSGHTRVSWLCDQQRVLEAGPAPAQASDQAHSKAPCCLPDSVSFLIQSQCQTGHRFRSLGCPSSGPRCRKTLFRLTESNA